MRKSNNQIIFSASDLSNHIHCKHLTNLNYGVVQGLKEKPISNNKVLEVLRQRGIDFENSFLIELEAKLLLSPLFSFILKVVFAEYILFNFQLFK